MATMNSVETRSMIAGSDLSSSQFFFVSLAADGEVDATGDGAEAFGVLLNEPAAGEAATVAVKGRVLVEAGGTVTRGGDVASDANGNAVDATTGDIILGKALEAGVDGQIIAIEFNGVSGGNTA